jgi:hypothetical protein
MFRTFWAWTVSLWLLDVICIAPYPKLSSLLLRTNFEICFAAIRLYVPNRDEVTGKWRKLHGVQVHNLFSSPNIISEIKSRRLRWAIHVAHMGD